MNNNRLYKIIAYVFTIFFIGVQVVECVYRIKGLDFFLEPSLVALVYLLYYFFMDYVEKEKDDLNKVKRMILWMLFLYSVFRLIALTWESVLIK